MHIRNFGQTFTVAAAAVSAFLLFFCGIYRSDMQKEKYLALGAPARFECVGIMPAALNTASDEQDTEVAGSRYGVSGPAYPPDDVAPRAETIGAPTGSTLSPERL